MWSAANNNIIYVFDLLTHAWLRELQLHSDCVRSLCYLGIEDNMERVASGSGDFVLYYATWPHLFLYLGSADGSIILWHNEMDLEEEASLA